MPSTLALGNSLETVLGRPLKAARIVFLLNEQTLLGPEFIRALTCRSPLPLIIRLAGDGETGHFADYTKYEPLLNDILAYKPDFIFTASRHAAGESTPLHLFSELWRIPFVHWYVDDPELLTLHDYEAEMDMEISIVNCGAWVAPLQRRGYGNVHFVPMAGSPDRFRIDPDLNRDIPISFIGSHGAEKSEAMWAGIQKEFMGLWPLHKDEVYKYRDEGFEWVKNNPGQSVADFIDMKHEAAPTFVTAIFKSHLRVAMCYILDLLGTTPSRVGIVKSLVSHGIKVWGPMQWMEEIPRENFSGPVHYTAIHEIYQQSKLVLNVSRNQSLNVADQRHFEAALCGAVVVTEDVPGQRAFFDDDEVLYYSREDEVAEKVAALLADEPRRAAMAEKARAKVLAMHTYDHRANVIERIVLDTARPKPRFLGRSMTKYAETWIDRLLAKGEVQLARRVFERAFPHRDDYNEIIEAHEGKRPLDTLLKHWAGEKREKLSKVLELL